MLRGQLFRLLRVPALVTASVLVLIVALLVAVAWRGMLRLGPVQEHVENLGALQDFTLAAEQMLAESRSAGQPISPARLEALRAEVAELGAAGRQRATDTPDQLQEAARALRDDSVPAGERLTSTLALLRTALDGEQRAQRRLLNEVFDTSRFEFELALALLLALPLAGFGVVYLLRDRVGRPLGDLALLLDELSLREYRKIPGSAIEKADPALEPVYRNYNMLVSRLRALEEEHHRREHTLEREVREATATLLELNRQLAESERLAAVGAVSAGFAHELRNPLAGIRMACSRLRDALKDPSHVERLNMVLDEIDRLNQLLNTQLAQARHAPEPATQVGLEDCIESLLSLLRYQVPEHVRLGATVSGEIRCSLPVGQLRQAVMNLVLNAAQALGDGPGSIAVAAQTADGRLSITVTDDGPGFSPRVLSAPLRAFVTAREGGTGLGLSTVHRFAQDIGGQVTLENVNPHGARVTLVVPCEPSHG